MKHGKLPWEISTLSDWYSFQHIKPVSALLKSKHLSKQEQMHTVWIQFVFDQQKTQGAEMRTGTCI